ncbi:TPA: hypothetical protein ACLAR8_001162 [Neisseria meningitidis]
MDGQTDTAQKPRRQKCRLKSSDGIFGHITCKRQHIPTQTD